MAICYPPHRGSVCLFSSILLDVCTSIIEIFEGCKRRLQLLTVLAFCVCGLNSRWHGGVVEDGTLSSLCSLAYCYINLADSTPSVTHQHPLLPSSSLPVFTTSTKKLLLFFKSSNWLVRTSCTYRYNVKCDHPTHLSVCLLSNIQFLPIHLLWFPFSLLLHIIVPNLSFHQCHYNSWKDTINLSFLSDRTYVFGSNINYLVCIVR